VLRGRYHNLWVGSRWVYVGKAEQRDEIEAAWAMLADELLEELARLEQHPLVKRLRYVEASIAPTELAKVKKKAREAVETSRAAVRDPQPTGRTATCR
jgi:hypothetical protein